MRTHPFVSLAIGGALSAALAFGLAGPAGSTTVRQEGTAQLLDHADTVVRGTVVRTEARMHPEHHFIYTYVTVHVDEALKGSAVAGSEIVLQELGGRVDRTIHLVEGIPTYNPGERVLSFLENHESGYYRTYGMIQGKFTFERDVRTGREILTRPAEWNAVATATGLDPLSDIAPMRVDGAYDAAELLGAIHDQMGR